MYSSKETDTKTQTEPIHNFFLFPSWFPFPNLSKISASSFGHTSYDNRMLTAILRMSRLRSEGKKKLGRLFGSTKEGQNCSHEAASLKAVFSSTAKQLLKFREVSHY